MFFDQGKSYGPVVVSEEFEMVSDMY
jgi:hypothetical protein